MQMRQVQAAPGAFSTNFRLERIIAHKDSRRRGKKGVRGRTSPKLSAASARRGDGGGGGTHLRGHGNRSEGNVYKYAVERAFPNNILV